MAYLTNQSVTGLPEFMERAKLPGNYDFMSKFKNLYDQYGFKSGNMGANVGGLDVSGINLPDQYTEDPYSFKSVDPTSAINAAKGPIESQKQKEFAEAGARYGAGGGLQSSGYAEFGLGKASARAAENIAAMTEKAMLDASKFNTEMEATMANARQQRMFGGWQARGGWDVSGQMDKGQRELEKRAQDIQLALGNASLKQQGTMSPGEMMALLGMDAGQGQQKFSNENLLNKQGYESRMGMGSLLGSMPYSKADIISQMLGGGGIGKYAGTSPTKETWTGASTQFDNKSIFDLFGAYAGYGAGRG